MTVAEYLAGLLAKNGTTDAFGVPGGVILDLIYALDKIEGITPHLSYHEQAAGFAGCGYAQASGKIGVAYATRGPGFTNLITAIADAYCDSLPVLFITGHAASLPPSDMRVMDDQEMDTCSMVKNITKMAVRVDDETQAASIFKEALQVAQEARKGPVLLDIAASIMKKQIDEEPETITIKNYFSQINLDFIEQSIREAKKPLILIGDGVHQSGAEDELRLFVEKCQLPVVSSRYTHDIGNSLFTYYGYVGSHGIRTANFLLSKTDLIISFGNRMHYPVASESFRPVTQRAKTIRIDIDEAEFNRQVPNTTLVYANVKDVLESLNSKFREYGHHEEWLEKCSFIKAHLSDMDLNSCVESIEGIFKLTPVKATVVSDVGNNEFWLSRASVACGNKHRTLYSKSFGALGCGLGKAIGTYYATRQPVICFVGDQGLQMNIQELQYIGQHQLPIQIILLNNSASAMIKDRETGRYDHYLHTTKDSGYGNPDFGKVAKAFGLAYSKNENIKDYSKAGLMEIMVDDNLPLSPSLPQGYPCQDLHPQIDRKLYETLNQI